MKTSLLLGSYAIISTLILTEASLPALANPRSPKPPEFETKVLLRGLQRPTGIAVQGGDLYFTEVPNPGTPNAGNAVRQFDLDECDLTLIHEGEPEPVNIAIGKGGDLYWTCKSAGVILSQEEDSDAMPLLTGLEKPSGISVDRWDRVYFTFVPTPAVGGMNGGRNGVAVFDGEKITTLNMGEPEPTDIVVNREGTLYWTCKSAGVILTRTADGASALCKPG